MTLSFIMMNRFLNIIFLVAKKLVARNEQTNQNQVNNFEISKKNAHENAQKLLVQDFYWSSIEEGSPFGNDDGYDAFHSFYHWRKTNRNQSPIAFLMQMIKSWNFPEFNLVELDNAKIEAYVNPKTSNSSLLTDEQIETMKKQMMDMSGKVSKEFSDKQFIDIMNQASSDMGGTYLMSIDNAIISVGFGQYVLEGTIDEEVRKLTKIALERESMPVLINNYTPEYRESRLKIISAMISDLEKMK